MKLAVNNQIYIKAILSVMSEHNTNSVSFDSKKYKSREDVPWCNTLHEQIVTVTFPRPYINDKGKALLELTTISKSGETHKITIDGSEKGNLDLLFHCTYEELAGSSILDGHQWLEKFIKGKNTQKQIMNARSKASLSVMNNYEIIEKPEESFSDYSEWYNATVTRVPVYCKLPDGREVFLLNRLTGTIESSKQKDNYIVRDIEEHKKEIEAFVDQLKENSGRWFDRYCKWGYHPEETKKLGPIEFIDWVESKGYTFNKNITDLFIEDSRTSFGGNLNERSCAFSYDILDETIVEKIKMRIPDIKIIQ